VGAVKLIVKVDPVKLEVLILGVPGTIGVPPDTDPDTGEPEPDAFTARI
jgi:hypothetical protein